MFEDPKKELTDLDAVLRSLDQKDEVFEDFYAKILDEFGGGTPAPEQNRKAPRPAAPVQDPQPADSAYADRKKAPPAKKDKSVRNLSILIIMELLGIAAVAAYWCWRLM